MPRRTEPHTAVARSTTDLPRRSRAPDHRREAAMIVEERIRELGLVLPPPL